MSSKRVDWTDERHRRIIEEQRKFLWTPEQLERLAAWIGLEAGWTMLDLGCGYGYLGRTYATHVSPGGRVVCVDREAALLEEARRRRGNLGKTVGKMGKANRRYEKGARAGRPLYDGLEHFLFGPGAEACLNLRVARKRWV
jgi:protein-L-isoaspartate O-methyltransferase